MVVSIEFILKSFTNQNILYARQVIQSIFSDGRIQAFSYPTKIKNNLQHSDIFRCHFYNDIIDKEFI